MPSILHMELFSSRQNVCVMQPSSRYKGDNSMQAQDRNRTSYDNILSAWRAQLAKAAENPDLNRRLLHTERELLPRFASQYTKLMALPRRVRRTMQRQWKQSLGGVALLLALGQTPALAATINVGGGCTLTDAITAANDNAATGRCPAGSGADTIVLPPSSTHILTVVNNESGFGEYNGLPVIESAITISGNGATIRRASDTPPFRIFLVNFGATLTLRQTTVSGGALGRRSGGGVCNRGTLNLTGSTITNSTLKVAGAC